jgi:hypothetical protein
LAKERFFFIVNAVDHIKFMCKKGLFRLRRRSADLASVFGITAKHIQRDSRSERGFRVLFGCENKRGIKLPRAVPFQRAENITDYFPLPIHQLKLLARPLALRSSLFAAHNAFQ